MDGCVIFDLQPTVDDFDLVLCEITMNLYETNGSKEFLLKANLNGENAYGGSTGGGLYFMILPFEITEEEPQNDFVTYKIIDGELTNDETLTEANCDFDSCTMIYSPDEAPYCLAIMLQPHSRVNIDYSNKIFEKDQYFTGGELDPSKTDIQFNSQEGTYYIRFFDVNGDLYDMIELVTEGVTKNHILYFPNGGETDENGEELSNHVNTDYLKIETGENIETAKEKSKSIIDRNYKQVFAYMNKEGQYKSCTISEHIGEIGFHESDNESIVNLNMANMLEWDWNDTSTWWQYKKLSEWEGLKKDDDKLSTSDCAVAEFYIDKTSIPDDFDYEKCLNKNIMRLRYYQTFLGFIVCTGDITQTGEIDVTDLSTMQEFIVDNIELEKIQQIAADMNDDNEVDVVDLSEMQEYIVNH